ncbi:MAG: carboxypeptidase regulatory-like domain-containing protein, partial [Gammaproteobacteria bacterium]|nr:carboxypeptidase regulatory-like domain-containing protein [Gammaproteobacteria bacterium]
MCADSGAAPRTSRPPSDEPTPAAAQATPASPESGRTDAVAKAGAPAELSLVIFERGNPVSGVELKVNGKRYGVTDTDGALWANIPSGRRDVVLVRDSKPLVELDFLTDAGESLQMLVTLPETPAARPRIDVASTAGGEQVKIVRDDTALEEKGPPGALTGRIVAADSGAPISGARLYFAGQATDATTDKAGRYAVELPAGNYRLSVVHPDYATQKLDNVRVIPGKQVTSNIELSPAGLALADYVVTAPYVEGSISSVFDTQREAEGVIDIIGAEQMARTGDSDAAQALGRVTGLTIEDGQYAVIRGQPERYTFSTFNGSPLPSPDPIQRIVPLDLFPAGVLKSIAVQKSYTADQPGEFGGGLVALSTRDIPDEAFGAVSVRTGFNSLSTNKDGLTYAGGSTDFLGFDDGARELPAAAAGEANLGNLSIDQQNAIGAQFPNSYNVTNETLPPDSGLSIVGGGAF